MPTEIAKEQETVMKLVRELLIILGFVVTGDFLYKVVHVPIPGNILGMMLLLIGLLSGKIKLKQIETVSQFLLSHLALFFIPTSVGLLAVTGILQDAWYKLLIISVVSTLIFMITTAYVVMLLRRLIK